MGGPSNKTPSLLVVEEEPVQQPEGPKFSKSLTDKIKENKATVKRQEPSLKHEFDIRMFPNQYRPIVKPIVDDFNKLASGVFKESANQMHQTWTGILQSQQFGE